MRSVATNTPKQQPTTNTMSRITKAFIHIPTFRELAPVSRDAEGKWTIDDVPSHTYVALGHERFTAWKDDVLTFIQAGRISGSPEGLTYELLASAAPGTDWLCLQAFGQEVLRILDENATGTDEQAIRESAVKLGLAHYDAESRFRLGEAPDNPA